MTIDKLGKRKRTAVNLLKFKTLVRPNEKLPVANIICVGMYLTSKSRSNASEMFIESLGHLLMELPSSSTSLTDKLLEFLEVSSLMVCQVFRELPLLC